MNIPMINIQEAFNLYSAIGKVSDVSSIRPPYNECILFYSPFKNCTEFKKISCYNEEYFDVSHFAFFNNFKDGRDAIVYYSGVRIYFGPKDGTSVDYEIFFINGIEDERVSREAQLMFQDNLFFTLFSLNLMNCRNIKYTYYDPNENLTRQIRRNRQRNNKPPYLSYEILEIQPTEEKNDKDYCIYIEADSLNNAALKTSR